MTTLRFAGDLPLWAALLLGVVGFTLAWRFYRRESRYLSGRLPWLLPTLRGSAILVALLIFAGPILHHRHVEGVLGEVLILLDSSASMAFPDSTLEASRKQKIAAALGWIDQDTATGAVTGELSETLIQRFNDSTRFERSTAALLDATNGLLPRLRERHHVRLSSFADENLSPLWDSKSENAVPTKFTVVADGGSTQIGWAASRAATIAGGQSSGQITEVKVSDGEANLRRTAIVIFSDGQNNDGVAPLQVARVLGSQEVPVYTIALGDPREPNDLAVLSADYPQRVFAKNRVRGKLRIKDHLPVGQSFKVAIRHNEELLWSKQLDSINSDSRLIDFDFDVESLAAKLQGGAAREVKYNMLPIGLTAEITTDQPDFIPLNDQFPMRLAVVTSRYRVLLIDARSRWETRYLKNVFERDEAWQLKNIVLHRKGDEERLPVGDGEHEFPRERAGLMAQDLIILGDISSSAFSPEQLVWLHDFVDLTGGGLIWIDGPRGSIDSYTNTPLEALLPVKRIKDPLQSIANHLQLTSLGKSRSQFLLDADKATNERLWRELPAPHWSAVTESLPGSEVLVETVVLERTIPTFVTRRFGAGNVLYSATDESWRWRYKVGDTYHQRFWNQIGRWVMRSPMAVSDDHVSLDSGATSYASGESAKIRARLQDTKGRGVADATVEALMWNGDQVVGAVFLSPDPQNPGFYFGETAPLAPGDYEVSIRASGFPADSMKARSGFSVAPQTFVELQRVACNQELLKQMSAESKGEFLLEEDFQRLPELLEPLSSGRLVESDTLLWQSYWWFALIIGLLAFEWWLRKRGGLI